MKKLAPALVLIFLVIARGYSQVEVNGSIQDRGGLPLIGALIAWDTGYTSSDEDGKYTAILPTADALVTISYIGYRSISLAASTIDGRVVYMDQQDMLLEATTITASRYQQRISDATVSVEILRPDLITATNTIDFDDALEKVSGVQVTGGQANIRGGSGFSYGAGSRVMLLIDDLPALQVDAGFTNWGDLPVENIGQVEVVKGAASSLYGSAALNGIINVRTGEPTSTPYTQISLGANNYRPLGDDIVSWYQDSLRYNYVVSAVHRRKIGKLDFTTSIFHTRDENFNQATFKDRKRATVKLNYHLTDRLSISLNTMLNKGDNGDFLLWRNAQDGPLEPFPGTVSTQDNLRLFIDPSVRYRDTYGNQHRLLLRHHYIDNSNNNNQSNQSKTYYGEYQIARKLESHRLDLTAGMVASSTSTAAELFGDTTFTTTVLASYVQVDHELSDDWSVSAGLRYEYNRQITPDSFNMVVVPGGEIVDSRPVARLGSRYKISEYGTFRASWGQGYRFPTVTERFISTVFGGFAIAPNPDLVPERGWTAEVGYKQGLSWLGWRGYVDVAMFTSQYRDMMEFVAAGSQLLAFTSQNVGATSIYGAEVSIYSQTDIGQVQLQLFGGYTYIDPRYQDLDARPLLKESLSSEENVLKYRSKHNAKMDAQLDYKGFSLGLSANYSSHIVNMDRVFELVDGFFVDTPFDIIGLHAFRQSYNRGYTRYDTRLSYTYKQYKLSLLINNLTNAIYIKRPGLLEAPRTIGARVDLVF